MQNAGGVEAELKGQVAVVTGAARGIGEAIAEKLAAMGAHVVLTARDEVLLNTVKASIEKAGGKATSVVCDLTDEAAIAALADRVRVQSGRCDVLVNCAGVATAGTPLHELAPSDWDAMMNVNLKAPYLLIRAFAPLMIAANYGHIVNISSLAGKNPLPNGAAYSASKWGLNGLTYSVAEELRQYNIRVSVVAPGSVNTHFGGTDATAEKAARKIQAADVARVVAMLVTQSPQSFVSEVLLRPTKKL
jgi:3-oxoacyl-[acyl-carrier protein] reductase